MSLEWARLRSIQAEVALQEFMARTEGTGWVEVNAGLAARVLVAVPFAHAVRCLSLSACAATSPESVTCGARRVRQV